MVKMSQENSEESKENIDTVEEEVKKPQKSKYIFNCTKCGECCEKKEFIPIANEDLLNWVKNGVINTIIPHLEIGTLQGQNEGQTFFQLMLKQKEPGCPMYDATNKICNIYHSLPLDCASFPLGFNGQSYFIRDKSCPGIGNGTMTKEQLVKDREVAQKDFLAKIDTYTILPVIYSLFMKNILKEQERVMKEMPDEKRQQLEDLLGEKKKEEEKSE